MGGLVLAALVLIGLSAVFLGRRPSSRTLTAPGGPARASLLAARELPGGEPSRAIPVDSPIVIDRHAERWPCPVCGGAVRCEPHRVEHLEGARYRVARPCCPRCGFERDVYFVLRPSTAAN